MMELHLQQLMIVQIIMKVKIKTNSMIVSQDTIILLQLEEHPDTIQITQNIEGTLVNIMETTIKDIMIDVIIVKIIAIIMIDMILIVVITTTIVISIMIVAEIIIINHMDQLHQVDMIMNMRQITTHHNIKEMIVTDMVLTKKATIVLLHQKLMILNYQGIQIIKEMN